MNKILSEHIESCIPKKWKGFRLIAGDGTTVNLPPSPQVKEHFGIFDSTKSNKHTCLANACMLYDVLSGLVLDTIISPCSIGEGTLLANMINNARFSGAIILLDRGFGFFATCKNLLNKQLGFCIRIKGSQSDFAKKILLNPLADFITDWSASESERKTCKQGGLDILPIQVRVKKNCAPWRRNGDFGKQYFSYGNNYRSRNERIICDALGGGRRIQKTKAKNEAGAIRLSQA